MSSELDFQLQEPGLIRLEHLQCISVISMLEISQSRMGIMLYLIFVVHSNQQVRTMDIRDTTIC